MANDLGTALGNQAANPDDTACEVIARILNTDLFVRSKMEGRSSFDASDVARLGKIIAHYDIHVREPERGTARI